MSSRAAARPRHRSERFRCSRFDDSTALRVLREDDARELFALTDANRAHLRVWLPWVDLVRVRGRFALVPRGNVSAQREDGRGPTFGFVHDGAIAGVVGFLPIDRVNRVGEIGYWLAERRRKAAA